MFVFISNIIFCGWLDSRHQLTPKCFSVSTPKVSKSSLCTFPDLFSTFKLSPSPFSYPLIAGVVGAPQMTSQPVSSIFFCSPLSPGTLRTPDLSIPWCCLPTSICLPCLLPPFTVPRNMALARPDERETCLYHFSLRLFTMVRRSSCGPIACWILAWTSSLVTWSLYEMWRILR